MAVTPVGNPYVESSDLVANYPGASEALAERIDIVGVNPFADSAARATAIPSPTEGMMSSLNDTEAVQRYDGATWKPVGGKVLQVVRATNSTDMTSTSTSFVDVTGMAVTITPQVATSRLLIVATFVLYIGAGACSAQITKSDNTVLSGAEAADANFGGGSGYSMSPLCIIGYVEPGSVSSVTYKLRAKVDSSTFNMMNSRSTGQMYAIEVAA